MTDIPFYQTRPHLARYLEEENSYRERCGRDVLKTPLGKYEVSRLAGSLEAELQPESLYLDGERPADEVAKRLTFLKRVARELGTLGIPLPDDVDLDYYIKQYGR